MEFRTSVAHLDSPKVVDFGLTQMLSLIVDDTSDADLDVFLLLLVDSFSNLLLSILHAYMWINMKMQVHLIGGFEDIASKVWPRILPTYWIFKDVITRSEAEWLKFDILTFVCSMLIQPLGQNAFQNQMVIPFLCVPKLSKVCRRDQKTSTLRPSLFLGITPSGTLREMHTPFFTGSWLAWTLSNSLFL